jgi:NADPH:quinone reductase-like Zn-dependent oxidoreductase
MFLIHQAHRKPVIQLAKLSKFSPIITTASLKHTDFLKFLGATHVFDRNLGSVELSAEISKVTKKPIRYVFDAISLPSTQQIGIDVLASGGKLALVEQLAVDVPKDKTVIEITARSRAPSNIELLEHLYHDKISGYVAKGFIKVSLFCTC